MTDDAVGADGFALFIEADADIPAIINGYLVEDYVVLDHKTGDINGDGQTDLILILKRPKEAETSDVVNNPEPRPLLLIVNNGSRLSLRELNPDVVLCVDCGGLMGDPYSAIAHQGDYFSIEHYGGSSWRWTHIVTFRYDGDVDNWVLHKVGGVSYHSSDPESSMEESVLSTADFGTVLFRDYDDADFR